MKLIKYVLSKAMFGRMVVYRTKNITAPLHTSTSVILIVQKSNNVPINLGLRNITLINDCHRAYLNAVLQVICS